MFDFRLQLIEATVTILIVAALLATVARKRPRLAYALSVVALLKCLMPIGLASPTGVFSWASLFWSYQIASAPWAPSLSLAEIPPERVRSGDRWHYTLVPRVALEPEVLAKSGVTSAGGPGKAKQAGPSPSRARGRLLAVCWLAGSGLVASSLWVRWRHSLILVRDTMAPGADLLARCNSVRLRLGLSHRVDVRVSHAVGPVSFGVWKPSIILPLAVVEGPRSRLELVLAHELMHLKRRDPLLAWLQVASQVVWWFHPLVWWLNRKVCDERERACDEQVLRALGCPPAEYARCLLEVVELRLNPQLGFAFAAMPAWGLKRRFEQVLSAASARRTSAVWTWLVAVSLAALLFPGSAPNHSLFTLAPALRQVWRVGQTLSIQPLPHIDRHPPVTVQDFRRILTRRIGRLELVPHELSIALDRKSAAVRTWRASFSGKSLSPAELAAIAELPSVFSLHVEIVGGGDVDRTVRQVTSLAALHSIHNFTLQTLETAACDLGGLGRLTSLRGLSLDCPGFTDRGMVDCQGLLELEGVHLACPNLGDAGFATLGNYRNLTQLSLECPQLTDQGATFLSQLTQLRELHLGGGESRHVVLGEVTDGALWRLRGNTQLRSLWIYAPRVTGEGLAAFEPHHDLRYLTVEGRFTSDGWRSVGKLRNLRVLQVRSPDGAAPSSQLFSELPELRHLSLDQVVRDDAQLAAYAELPQLQGLFIHRSKVSPEAVQRLQREFEKRGHEKQVVHYFDSPPVDW